MRPAPARPPPITTASIFIVCNGFSLLEIALFARKGKTRKRDGVSCNILVMLPKGTVAGTGARVRLSWSYEELVLPPLCCIFIVETWGAGRITIRDGVDFYE